MFYKFIWWWKCPLLFCTTVLNFLRLQWLHVLCKYFWISLYLSGSCSPTFQCGSYVYLLQMFLHMHINTAVWRCTHIVSLWNTCRLTYMVVSFLSFTLVPTIYSRQWNQKICSNQWMRKTIPSYLPFLLLPSGCKPLLSLMPGPQSWHLWHLDLHCNKAAPSPRA